ncbi:hypothetical protein E2C01_001967 [Portunus trituberculatus]|uniref:Uncharacterized protein n=1 Tax=Portunus trituberculatus TaxID=210409 RepID=A0A5B7CJL4_PORTR|nr:hypothetical protein [Portunus trituberculatus]
MKSCLTRDKKDQNACCKFCNTAIKPKLSVLRAHMTSKKHRALADSVQGSNKLSSLLKREAFHEGFLLITTLSKVRGDKLHLVTVTGVAWVSLDTRLGDGRTWLWQVNIWIIQIIDTVMIIGWKVFWQPSVERNSIICWKNPN